MDSGQYIGLDVGEVRTGIARASVAARIAEPVTVAPTDQVARQLKSMSKVQKIAGIVIGLPRNLDGEETKQTHWVKQWAKSLKSEFDLPMWGQDEALTTKSAEAAKSLVATDASAAAIILGDFLQSPENARISL